jgi:hypothetical protein
MSARCHYAECHVFIVMLSVIMVSVVMLNVIMLSVVMLSVVAPPTHMSGALAKNILGLKYSPELFKNVCSRLECLVP